MVTVVVFEFSVTRCQPLRRALNAFRDNFNQGAIN
ncbi:acetyltransferase [Vibrio cholerae]|nr:acetyltransferase [Vibrio cholerae]EJL6378721.1 acetyltransferase [Vibrio cholerae]ELI3479419.1 acetyltransferase [Vibrio cholerae]